jgi:hypothetical protein
MAEQRVVVPRRPGPVVPVDGLRTARARDDLDEIIDELLPDVEEAPGWFDAALITVGLALVASGLVLAVPIALVIGGIVLALGAVLPVRAAWRRAARRRADRRRKAVLDGGELLDASSSGVARLVEGYGALIELADAARPEVGGAATAAAHAAVSEVASLLGGRAPGTERERAYVAQRAGAIAALADALREAGARPDPSVVGPDAVLDAREEVDRLSPFDSVTRLEELTDELRIERRG